MGIREVVAYVTIFGPCVAGFVIFCRVRSSMNREGIWVSVRAFGIEATNRSWGPSVRELKDRIAAEADPEKQQKFRRWLRSLRLALFLWIFAIASGVTYSIWPMPHR